MNDSAAIFETYIENTQQYDDCVPSDNFWIDMYGDGQMYSDEVSQNPIMKINGATDSENWLINRASNGYQIKQSLHREDGPAIIRTDGRVTYCLNNSGYPDPQSWAKDVLISQRKPFRPSDIEKFLRPILAKQTTDLI